MSFVLKRTEDGKFVAPPGQHNSYTSNLRKAQTWATKQQALSNACGNEYAATIESQLNR